MSEIATKELDKYRNRMFNPTSKSDLMYMLGDAVKIIKYDEIKNFSTLKELLDPFQTVIILYPNANDSEVGHWCCLFLMPGTNFLQFFDSYGCFLDEKVGDFNEKDVKVQMHQKTKIEPKLLELILASDYADTTFWNDYPFQSNKIPTASCGLWCVVRIKNNRLNEEEFRALYLDAPEKQDILPDLLVATVICEMYPEKC